MTLILAVGSTHAAFAECDIKDLKKDIKEIEARKDYSAKERLVAIEQAKQNTREEIIECVIQGESITKAASQFVREEMENDQSTKPAAAKELLGLIDANTGEM